MRHIKTFLPLLFLSVVLQAQDKPKNIILLIGDGMGLSQITAGITVADNTQFIETFPVIGLMKTQSADEYVTDSAAGATAFATGNKTKNGYVSVDTNGTPLTTIIELASKKNIATGVVSTCAVTHATPACFVAHELSRNSYEAIAADFVESDINIFMGGGLDYFANRTDSVDLVAKLKEKEFTVITDQEQLSTLKENKKVAALLNDNHLPKYSEGRSNLLPEMAQKTLELLSANGQGFFVMIEGSQIDWGGHANDIDYITSEFTDFDNAIGVALEFAKNNKETLVIVTADHETGGLGLNNYDKETNKLEAGFTTFNHTGVMIPVFAFGPGAEKFSGVYENTDIFKKMVNLLDLL